VTAMIARTKLRCMLVVAATIAAACLAGCAASTSTMGGMPPIPEGRGRLILDTAGLGEVNFYVLDQATDEEVYSETPRLPGYSPAGYERGGLPRPQMCDLPPGRYTVVVNTDVEEPVQLPDVEVVMGETRYAAVPLGRFQVLALDNTGTRQQYPFLIYDYSMNAVLGRGMTSIETRYFLVPAGNYKIRLENAPSGMDEIRPVQVSVGQTQNLTIGGPAKVPTEEGATDTYPTE